MEKLGDKIVLKFLPRILIQLNQSDGKVEWKPCQEQKVSTFYFPYTLSQKEDILLPHKKETK